MATFVHKEFLPGDEAGFGLWRAEHYYEHLRFNLIIRDQPNATLIPEYDIYSWSEDKEFQKLWNMGHNSMHLALREFTGVTGINLEEVDFGDPLELAIWLENHGTEHTNLEEALGAT